MARTIALCVALLLFLSARGASAGPTFTVLRAFVGGSSSADSYAPLIADRAGNLYGTASAGGNAGCVFYASSGCGTVFELMRPTTSDGLWTEKVLHRFPGGNGPWMPVAGLSMDAAGDLFGMTTDGGPYGCFTKYCGTAFELKPPSKSGGSWAETVLYRFSANGGGNNPDSGLTLDADGNLYGTTLTYGPQDHGTVFRLSPPARSGQWWTETVLSGFDRGGNFPIGGVVFDKTGNLFGTTFYGGASDLGVLYELSPKRSGTWTETVLYEFGANACSPKTDPVFDEQGALYGTAQGCPSLPGAIYRLTPPRTKGGAWTEEVLSYFVGTSNYDPTTTLVINEAGDVFGTTASGGTYGKGSVFELRPPSWNETILHSFIGQDGEFPTAGPVFGAGGALYGTTLDGVYHRGPCKIGSCGVVFKVAP